MLYQIKYLIESKNNNSDDYDETDIKIRLK